MPSPPFPHILLPIASGPKYIAEVYTAVPTPAAAAAPGRLKRPRVEVAAIKSEDSIPVPEGLCSSATLRIAQLENEVALLRAQLRTNQQPTDQFIQGLQRDWDNLRRTCLSFQTRVGGHGVRLNRVEGHIDEIVEHLPSHYGWKSEIGSDYDPDATLDVEDGSQPVVEPWWSEEGYDVEVKKETGLF
ncbi:hypothetical protein K438DRAFT_1997076 [Mycena galopus ATCC 62051]|nr:hypothetical protein K438DRAFT_1997076 [Mycena galopus ATCC 62051]